MRHIPTSVADLLASDLLALPTVGPLPAPIPRLALPLALPLVLLLALLLVSLRRTPPSTLALRALRRGPIPPHVAFIMDGNRRWARRRALPAHAGHPRGGDKLLQSLQWCLHAGVRTVTVYAFSIENFKRSPAEVAEILALAERKFRHLARRADILHAHRVRVRVLGDLARLPHPLRRVMARVVADTAHYHDGPVLNVCFAYTARHDIATAVSDLLNLVRESRLRPPDLTHRAIHACLSTGTAKGGTEPHPHLLVRTSGETRLSDFLLWEAADAVLSFYPVLWPDLSAWDFVNILLEYQMCVAQRPPPGPTPTDFDRRTADGLAEIGRRYFQRIERYCGGVGAPS